MKKLLCGIGASDIQKSSVHITIYPFEPSTAYPEKTINASDINSISIDFGVSQIKTTNDIIFISSEKKDELKLFAENNSIVLSEHSWNWDWLLEPYVDTEYTEDTDKQITKNLFETGITKKETDEIRREVGTQMFKYNFDTMLWDWCSLGLVDVLSAMRVKYTKEEFREFYKRALEIDQRLKNT